MFKTILFDIDGVMLSEEHYFDASALTVYELLHRADFIGTRPEFVGLPEFQAQLDADVITQIRRTVFADDHVLHVMKSAGVNANWDMVFLQTAYQTTRLLEELKAQGATDDVEAIGKAATQWGWGRQTLREMGQRLAKSGTSARAVHYAAFADDMGTCNTKAELFEHLDNRLERIFGTGVVKPFSFGNTLWNLCRDIFQEWYLGDKHHPTSISTGKTGFLENEDALVEPDALKGVFETCLRLGIEIGIATGRPGIETRVPLISLGWLPFFDASRISTADDVLEAEREAPERAPLSKPNPYSYLRSYLKAPGVKRVLETNLPLSREEGKQILIVGDSVADLLAAKGLGCRFAGVLTGLAGEAARQEFESLGADYIFDDVLSVREVLV